MGALQRWAKIKENPVKYAAYRKQSRQSALQRWTKEGNHKQRWKTPHKWWASINKDPVKLAAYYQKRKEKRLVGGRNVFQQLSEKRPEKEYYLK